MYKLSHYTEQIEELVLEFMQKNSFAFVTGMLDGFPVATRIPLEINMTGLRHTSTSSV